ncbi:MAG: DnaD domain protein [Lachnospira sp.]|nr:DnaD domain protein [Lachnospira sp.]
MVILGQNDMFKVHRATLVADYDRETLTNLYQPLIGYGALALYFTLWSEADMQRVNPLDAHESLLAKMKISIGEFIKARKALEGVGLVKTYLEDNKGAKIYTYELFAPKSPNEFFSDTLLYGLLINYIGEVDAKKLNNYYSSSYKISGNDISSSFKEVFHPNFENVAFIKALNNAPALGRNRAKMSLEFSYERFYDALKEVSQISEKAFSKGELKEIVRLASLNGLDETSAAHIVSNFYDPSLEKGKRVDLLKVTKAFQEETNYNYLSSFSGSKASSKAKPNTVSSKNALAQKINIMESVSPKEYLMILQNGTEPALPDLKLIDYLSKKFKLNNAVLNAVIDYTLEKNNNILSKAYCEKICASIVRSNIETTVDAMNYLKAIARGSSKKEYIKEDEVQYNEPVKSKSSKKEVNKDEEKEWESLMAELEEIGDGNDGKA